MSTKTTFKRVALVTVAALGFGMVAAMPSFAAPATTTVVKVGPGAAGDGAPGTTQDIYTSAGTEVTSVIRVLTTTAETAGDITITPTVACAGTVATTCTGGLTVGAAGAGKVGMTTAGTLGAAVALTATVNKWTSSATAGVMTLGWSSGTVPAIATTALQVVGTLSMTPSIPGIYTVTLTPSGAVITNTATVYTLYVSGAAGTVGTSGVGTKEITATTGGQASLEYFTPDATTIGTKYTFTSTGVGSIIGGQGYTTAHGTASLVTPSNGTNYTNGATFITATATTPSSGVVTVNSSVDGVQTITITKIDATTGTPVAVTTATITWTAAPTISATNSTSVIDSTTATGATAVHAGLTTDDKVTASGVTVSADVATIKVVLKDSAKNVVSAKTITATISGPGLIQAVTGTGAANTFNTGSLTAEGRAATADTDALGQVFIRVSADGSGGVGTITISQGTTVLATETLTFSGTATQLKDNNFDADDLSLSKVNIGIAETGILHVGSYDVSGNKVSANPTGLVVTSDSTTVATVAITGGTGDITVTGVAAGKANITVSVGALATATIKLVIPVTITKKTAKTVSMAFDKATYAPGEKMILTVSAVDSNGSPVADGSRVLFSDTVTANVALGTLPTGTVALVGGKKTYTYYAPFAAGSIVLTGTEGAALDAVIASTTAAPYTAAKIIASATVVNAGADAAQAAAEEATAAANDATDAALSAAEAAEAATAMAQEAVDAVAELSAQVTSLISALRAQITALTNLVVKIQKKVKA
jgi:hypothetical protein